MIARNSIVCMDALDLLRALPDGSVDCVLTDMPYGITACSWDTVIDLAAWWPEVWRVCKPRAAVVCTASQPFTSVLVVSAIGSFRHEWIWYKSLPVGHLNAKRKPLLQHESILVFGGDSYFPQFRDRIDKGNGRRGEILDNGPYNSVSGIFERSIPSNKGYPTSIIPFSTAYHAREAGLHPTQKPVALFEYLIRTYTQPGDLVLDPFVGSGTTAVAARNAGRDYIGCDISPEYVQIARDRLDTTPYKPVDARDDDVSDLPLFAGLGE